jgi:hypothetical protein
MLVYGHRHGDSNVIKRPERQRHHEEQLDWDYDVRVGFRKPNDQRHSSCQRRYGLVSLRSLWETNLQILVERHLCVRLRWRQSDRRNKCRWCSRRPLLARAKHRRTARHASIHPEEPSTVPSRFLRTTVPLPLHRGNSCERCQPFAVSAVDRQQFVT